MSTSTPRAHLFPAGMLKDKKSGLRLMHSRSCWPPEVIREAHTKASKAVIPLKRRRGLQFVFLSFLAPKPDPQGAPCVTRIGSSKRTEKCQSRRPSNMNANQDTGRPGVKLQRRHHRCCGHRTHKRMLTLGSSGLKLCLASRLNSSSCSSLYHSYEVFGFREQGFCAMCWPLSRRLHVRVLRCSRPAGQLNLGVPSHSTMFCTSFHRVGPQKAFQGLFAFVTLPPVPSPAIFPQTQHNIFGHSPASP